MIFSHYIFPSKPLKSCVPNERRILEGLFHTQPSTSHLPTWHKFFHEKKKSIPPGNPCKFVPISCSSCSTRIPVTEFFLVNTYSQLVHKYAPYVAYDIQNHWLTPTIHLQVTRIDSIEWIISQHELWRLPFPYYIYPLYACLLQFSALPQNILMLVRAQVLSSRYLSPRKRDFLPWNGVPCWIFLYRDNDSTCIYSLTINKKHKNPFDARVSRPGSFSIIQIPRISVRLSLNIEPNVERKWCKWRLIATLSSSYVLFALWVWGLNLNISIIESEGRMASQIRERIEGPKKG